MNAAANAASSGQRLRRVPRRTLLLVLLVPVLVVLWLPLLTGGRGKKATPPANPAAPQLQVAGQTPPAAPGGEVAPTSTIDLAASTAALVARLTALTQDYTPRWTNARGEPFGATAPVVAAPLTVTTTSDPLLAPTTIVLSKQAQPVAFVQGRTCRVGDTVAGRTIVAIEERRVVYRDGDATFAVPLPSPSLGTRP